MEVLLIVLHLLLLPLLGITNTVSADCECGYATATDDGSGGRNVFTDLIETDFARDIDVWHDTDWMAQSFNVTARQARGGFGEMFTLDGIKSTKGGGQAAGGREESGLWLTVKRQTVDGMVPGAEIDTSRTDLLWGSFRVGMRLTAVPGTCAAFFWYFNDTQEIDMEFLSKDFDRQNDSYPVNLVLQSREAAEAGYDARGTGRLVEANLPFDPTAGLHEYRIDLLPGQVAFYADGERLAEMRDQPGSGPVVPTSAGHLALRHWSNGNAEWSGGPPERDAAVVVGYVKAYFNSSAAARHQDWARRCAGDGERGSRAVCSVPEGAAGWFFSDRDNMTNNQTVFRENVGSALVRTWRWPTPLSAIFLATGYYALAF